MYDIFGSDISSNKVTLSGMVFSKREVEVLSFICSGRPHKVVAEALNLSVRTVETHVRNIVGKSGLGSMDRLIEHLTKSGDVHLLKKVYVHVLYMNDFNDFIKSLGKFNVSLSIFGDSLNDQRTTNVKNILQNMFEIRGDINRSDTIKVFIKCNKSSDTSAETIRAEHVINVCDDGVIVSILKFLLNFGNKDLVKSQINKYKTVVGGVDNKSTLDGNYNLEWSDNMKKGGKYGLLLSAGVAMAVIGYLYGMYPYADSSECVSNMRMVISDHVHLSRDKLFKEIQESLKITNEQPIRVAALVGPGGSGKTTLARMLMQHYKEQRDYGLVFEVNAESLDSARASLESCAWSFVKDDEKLSNDLKAISATSNATKRNEKIMDFIRKQLDQKKKWMFVFDNVDDIKEIRSLMPLDTVRWNKGQILITTRESDIKEHVVDLGGMNVHEIGKLTDSEKWGLFYKILHHIDKKGRYNSFSKDSVNKLLSIIPPYPLDISTIACSIGGRDISIEDYIEKLTKNTLPFDRSKAKSSDTEYGKTRYGIVVSALNEMLQEAKQNEGVQEKDVKSLFLLLSMCGSQRISVDLFKRFLKSDETSFIAGLDEYYFIDKLVNDKFSIHRVVQDILFDNLTREQMTSEEIEDFFETLFNNVFNYENITCEYRTTATDYRYEKTFFDSTASDLKHICFAIDDIENLSFELKAKYKAKALAAYSGILLVKGGNYKDIVSYLNEAISLDEKSGNNIFSDYDRAIIYYQLWSAKSQYDLDEAQKHMKFGLKLLDELGDTALPLKVAYNIDECASFMMSGNTKSGNESLEKTMKMLPEADSYWKTLALARLQLYSEDFELQNDPFNKDLARKVATKFEDLLKGLDADKIDYAISLAKQDKMPKIAASIMVEIVWAHILAEDFEAADEAYQKLKKYLKAYPMTKYDLRGDTYRVAILDGKADKLSGERGWQFRKEAYELGKKTVENWELVGSDSMVYETLADYGKVLVDLKKYDELVQYAEKYNEGTDLEGTLQVLINAKLFYYYGIAYEEKGKTEKAKECFSKAWTYVKDLANRINHTLVENDNNQSLRYKLGNAFTAFKQAKLTARSDDVGSISIPEGIRPIIDIDASMSLESSIENDIHGGVAYTEDCDECEQKKLLSDTNVRLVM